MELANEDLSSEGPKLPLKSHPGNKIRVLLDTGSNGDLYFHEKGKPKPFPYLTWQVPKSWHMSNGTFQTYGRGKFRIKFLDHSASREYLVQPDIVEYGGRLMSQPGFVFILGTDTLKELEIVQKIWTKEIDIDDIISPMRGITKLSTRSKIERDEWPTTVSWSMNLSVLLKPHNGCQDLGCQVWKGKSQYNSDWKLQPSEHLQSREVAEAPHWIWGPFWWNTRWLGHRACLPQAKGRCKATSWQAISNSKSPQRNLKTGNWETLWVRGIEMTVKIRMGITFIHSTKAEPNCAIRQWF